MFKKPYIDEDLCVGCGICETKCPLPDRAAVLSLPGEKPVLRRGCSRDELSSPGVDIAFAGGYHPLMYSGGCPFSRRRFLQAAGGAAGALAASVLSVAPARGGRGGRSTWA